MNISVSHDRNEETIEAKARWFQSLTMDERMEILCDLCDMILEVNPGIMDKKDVKPIPGRIQVLSKT